MTKDEAETLIREAVARELHLSPKEVQIKWTLDRHMGEHPRVVIPQRMQLVGISKRDLTARVEKAIAAATGTQAFVLRQDVQAMTNSDFAARMKGRRGL